MRCARRGYLVCLRDGGSKRERSRYERQHFPVSLMSTAACFLPLTPPLLVVLPFSLTYLSSANVLLLRGRWCGVRSEGGSRAALSLCDCQDWSLIRAFLHGEGGVSVWHLCDPRQHPSA